MASLRDMLPYILGGIGGAAGGADSIQSAATWSHRLRQDEKADERRDQLATQSARRLELAEQSEKRAEKEHKFRTSASERKEKQAIKDQGIKDTAREALQGAVEATAEQMVSEGMDPSELGGIQTRSELSSFRSARGLNRMTLDAGQEKLTGTDVGPGQSYSIWTRNGQITKRGATLAAAGTTMTQRKLTNLVDGITIKQEGRIDDLQDTLAEAQADFHNWRSENPQGGGRVGESGHAIDAQGRNFMRKVDQARRSIDREHRETLRKIEEKLIASGLSDDSIEKIMLDISGGGGGGTSNVEEVQGEGLPQEVIDALAAQGIEQPVEQPEQPQGGLLSLIKDTLLPGEPSARDLYN